MNGVVDVVIPVRNVDRYLGEALNSVARQGVECRVVVVDAGSDVPIELPALPVGLSVHLERSDAPLTAGGARNLGAALGGSEWVTFLDADDTWPDNSRTLLLSACQLTGADLAVGTVSTFHANEESRLLASPEGERTALLAGGVLLTRSAWEVVGEFDPTLTSGEFIEWYNRFTVSALTATVLDKPVLLRRLHLESTTAGQIRDRDDYLKVVRRWMSRND
ncbi:MAG: glycosyltransferase family A protein [Rhodoglobus sp.]